LNSWLYFQKKVCTAVSHLWYKIVKMKKIIGLLLTCCIVLSSIAQSNVGIGTASPAASAALDISSTTKGLLVPRMTASQRTSIANPAKGLLVYDTDQNGLFHYNGSAWATVGGSFTLPYSGSMAHNGALLNISNTGAGEGIKASTAGTFTAAIEGEGLSTGSSGVIGSSASTSGYGIYGLNATGTAVYGFSASGGVALRGISPTGYALHTNGNLRLSGGNTNPSSGAVLTSLDANGNAAWKARKIAFCAIDARNENISHEVYRKIEFSTKLYDHGDGFAPYAGTTTSGSSVYTVPVSGLYHFSSVVSLRYNTAVFNFKYSTIAIKKNGVIVSFNMGIIFNPEYDAYSDLLMNIDIPCVAGDKIWIEVYQSNTGSSSVTASLNNPITSRFSGHLVFAD
jgi:hypothetical protein